MEQELPETGCPNCERFKREVAQLKTRIETLEALLKQALRRSKRQAAPFSKGASKKKPKRPGRKSGDEYGQHHRRAVPERVDETYDVPLPECCSRCQSTSFENQRVAHQYQLEMPRKPLVRQFDMQIAECVECGNRLQGRHALQTSDALGAAVQLGKQTLARHGLDLMSELQRLTKHTKRNRANERFAKHLDRHLGEWFLFLFDPSVEATSNAAERALRPAVVNRKVWGGNRTAAGAHAQSILTSVIATCHRNTLNVIDYLSQTLSSTKPVPLFQ